MATVVRTTRGEVSLTMSPPRDDDDASTSPHLNTLKDSKGKGKTQIELMGAEVKTDVMSSSSRENRVNNNVRSQLEHRALFGKEKEEEGSEQEIPRKSTKTKSTSTSSSRANCCDANDASAKASSPTEQKEYVPTKLLIHNRIPSTASSIPHLMGRLSFVGIDAELPTTSLDDSYASSREGGVTVPQYEAPNFSLHQYATPTGYQIMQHFQTQQPFFAFDEQQAPSNSNMRSPVAGTQYRSRNCDNNVLSNNTPPHALGIATLSPPHKVPQVVYNQQVPKHLTELQYQFSPDTDPSAPNFDPHIGTEASESINDRSKEIEAKESSPAVANPLFEAESKKEPIPCHDKARSRKPTVQPILYSAINSLERYNEGSFDNKMLYAKAFGKQDKQRAFPGVPSKGPLKSTESRDSAAGSTWSSTSLGSNGGKDRRLCDDLESQSTASQSGDALHFRLEVSAAFEEKTSDERGEQQTFVNTKSALKKVVKSKSSNNLEESVFEINLEPESTVKTANRSVTIVEGTKAKKSKRRDRKEKKVGVFRPSCDAYTPRMGNRQIKYKPAQERESVEKMSSTMGTIQRPNFRDALRRVAIILHQHIVKIERRFETGIRGVDDTGLFKASMRDEFSEDNFATPRYKCSMVRVPMARPGVVYSMRKIRVVYHTPSTDEIYEFAHQLFKKVQLSSECSIVCLIYVEKLMEVAKVPLVSSTWRPIFMCGLLLASKVWQDLSSWNIEFASVYPQFSLEAINRLELQFLKAIKWDLYISSSLYAKYYFALRSLLEKSGFRDRYNQMVGGIGGIAASEAIKVSKRSEAVKEEALLQLSRSM
ncbi:hypothetical protein HJC23_005039 [Cyclotella cryptica]|uniref:Cyclin N-terminal domain-containing protein n=1 Tax=Cyclotella cryptica TaxID=29204 RepID=A0ABD3QF26_9STRA|eukprot:CCRYP_006262-RA/>CCRYP_006262-RA protein AED:0.01 eAED:0.01 QI:259/1/1/1/1/1/2/1956/821